jgi:hypothetical protein
MGSFSGATCVPSRAMLLNLAYYPDESTRRLLSQMRVEMRTVAQHVGDTAENTGGSADYWQYYD